MSLHYSAAHSSRITKKRAPSLKRSASSPFASFTQRKPVQRSKSKPEISDHDEDLFDERLDDLGIIATLATDLSLRDVAQIVKYANLNMFEPMPERGGFNSTRIAEILNFRRSLPKTVTVAHVHALSKSPTVTEREIAELTRANVLRKVVIPGRGTGGSTVGEGLILMSDLESMLDHTVGLDEGLKGNLQTPIITSIIHTKNSDLLCADKLLQHLRSHPLSSAIPPTAFTTTDLTTLKRAGFLTSSTPPSTTHSSIPTTPSTSLPTISRAASGSLAAIGGSNPIVDAGGTLTLRHHASRTATPLQLALPNTGPYLRLLTDARAHLLSLLHKSTRYRQLPLYLLRERWDGAIAADDAASRAKKARGEFAGVLPVRTRKWRQFCGLRFDWVLAECVGAGMVELFETGSVGMGVRVV
ncbi:MAG: hypothetical protein Q9182_000635 [Xanthomendoza sp. 2 TL-2023]